MSIVHSPLPFVRAVLTHDGRGEKPLKIQHIIGNFCGKFVDNSKKVFIIVFRMSTQKDKKAADVASLKMLSEANRVVGAKQIRKALNKGNAQRVFLAKNADPALTEPLVAVCQRNCVEYVWVRSMTELGNACGIEVGAAAAAVVA